MAGPGQGLGGVGDIIGGGKKRKACVAQIVAAQILQVTRPVTFFFFFFWYWDLTRFLKVLPCQKTIMKSPHRGKDPLSV